MPPRRARGQPLHHIYALVIDFADDTGDAPVSLIRARAERSAGLGVRLPGVELRTKTEPGERLPAALDAGWAPLPTG